MAATIFDLEVWFEDQDEPMLIRADQRDMAAFELEYRVGTQRAVDEMTMVYFRFLGWHAARRLGKLAPGLSRDDWLKTVVSVEPLGDEEPDQGNPTSEGQ